MIDSFNNILITGGAGFIGSHIANYLAKKYISSNIIVLDKLSYCSNVNNLDKCQNIKFIKDNILNINNLKLLLINENIDTIIHCAAESHVDNSFIKPTIFIENNVLGTQYLLEACRNNINIKKFIHVSTDEVYGSGSICGDASKEDISLLKPTNPYSASKASAEHFVECYYKSYKIPIIIVRMNNVYGPKQFNEKLIPKFLNLLSNNQKCTIHGNGENKRSFIYIDDVVRAFEIILNSNNKKVIGNIYNIGSDFEISNLQVTKKLIELFNGKKGDIDYNTYIEYIKDRPFNDFRYNIDYSKISSLGWSKTIDWDIGIQLTYDWFINNKDYWKNV